MIRKEAWPFYRTSSGVRLCWELEEPKGPKGFGAQPKSLQLRERCALVRWCLEPHFNQQCFPPLLKLSFGGGACMAAVLVSIKISLALSLSLPPPLSRLSPCE